MCSTPSGVRAGPSGSCAYPRGVTTALGVVLLVLGLPLLAVGMLGLSGRLPRNRFAGVRTPASLRSEEAFRVANRVGGLPIAVAGALLGGGGVLVLASPGTAVALVVGLLALVGGVLLAMAGGTLGDRAASLVPQPVRAGGCGGCCGGGCASRQPLCE